MNCSTGEVSSTLKGTDNVEPWFPALSTARTSSDYEEGSGARWMCYTQGAAAHGAPSRPLQRRTHAPAGSLTLLRLILRGLSRSTGHVRYCCAGSLERAHSKWDNPDSCSSTARYSHTSSRDTKPPAGSTGWHCDGGSCALPVTGTGAMAPHLLRRLDRAPWPSEARHLPSRYRAAQVCTPPWLGAGRRTPQRRASRRTRCPASAARAAQSPQTGDGCVQGGGGIHGSERVTPVSHPWACMQPWRT